MSLTAFHLSACADKQTYPFLGTTLPPAVAQYLDLTSANVNSHDNKQEQNYPNTPSSKSSIRPPQGQDTQTEDPSLPLAEDVRDDWLSYHPLVSRHSLPR